MLLSDYRKISPKLNADLTEVLVKYGFKLSKLNASVDERLGQVHLRISVADANHKDATGNSTTPERELFKQYASIYDLKPEWLDREFSMGRERYRVAGLRVKGRTKPLLIERLSDKSMRICEPDMVRNALLVESRAS